MINKKIKILYWISEKQYTRVFSSLTEDPRVEQAILLYNKIPTTTFKIKNIIKYNSNNFLKKIQNYLPDILVQCTTSKIIPNLKCKRAYINHGVWPDSITIAALLKDPSWDCFNLICGATHNFKYLFEKYSNIRAIIKSNTLTQFDNLYNNIIDQEKIKNDIIVNSTNPNAKKVITIFSHLCKNRVSLNPYNASYYEAAIRLAKMAENNNWLIIIKPKSNKVLDFLKNSKESWTKEIEKKYNNLYKNKFVKIIDPQEDPYRYFCTDLIINSARSTIEIEAALAKKPIISLRIIDRNLDINSNSYEMGTLNFNATYLVEDISNLETKVEAALFGDNSKLFEYQENFIKQLGISFDGNAHGRFIEHVLEIFK